MKFEKTPEISSITYMKKVKLGVERGKSGYTLSEAFAHTQTFDILSFGGKLDVSWNPESQVTPWGGLAYFLSYLKTSGLF